MWSSRARAAASLAAVVALAGCGFRMQMPVSYPDTLETVYIDTADRYTEFYRGLRASLERGGAKVTESPADASAVIRIEQDATGQNILTVSGRNVPTEFDVYYTVRYSVWRDGVELLPARTLTARQDYTYDATQVLGKAREEQVLREAVAGELVRQVSQQLSRL